jgi:hypothetical protein
VANASKADLNDFIIKLIDDRISEKKMPDQVYNFNNSINIIQSSEQSQKAPLQKK